MNADRARAFVALVARLELAALSHWEEAQILREIIEAAREIRDDREWPQGRFGGLAA